MAHILNLFTEKLGNSVLAENFDDKFNLISNSPTFTLYFSDNYKKFQKNSKTYFRVWFLTVWEIFLKLRDL